MRASFRGGSRPPLGFSLRRALFGLIVASATAGCASASAGLPPEAEFVRVPRDAPAVWRRAAPSSEAVAELAAVRRLLAFGRPGDAFRRLQPVLRSEPEYVDAERVLQDLTLHSVADMWLRERVAARIAAEPDAADSWYFRARVESDPQMQARWFDEAIRRDPFHPYARLGRAVCLARAGDNREAAAEAWLSAASAPSLHLPWLFLGTIALGTGDPARAEPFLREAAERDPADARPWAMLAAAFDDAAQPERAADAALEALRRAPGDPSVCASAGRMLERCGGPGQLAAALDVADAALPMCGEPVHVELLRGRLLAALGRADEAVAAFESAEALGAWPGDVAGPLRRARCAAGRYADAIDGALATLPAAEAGDDRQAAWESVRVAGAALRVAAGPDELRDAASAMLAVGWIDEARRVLMDAAVAGDRRAAALAAEAAAFRSFLDDLAAWARDLRRRTRRREHVSIDEAFDAIARISTSRLGRDASAGADVRSYPLIGEFASASRSGGEFHGTFERFGLAFVVGRRSGGTPDLFLARLVRREAGRRVTVLGREIVIDDHLVDAEGLPDGLTGLRSSLAGVTLDDMVFVQTDAVLRTPSPGVAGLPFVERTARTPEERTALDTPSDVARRIEAGLAAEGVLASAVIDAVRRHEYVHARDAADLLPLWRNPLRAAAFGMRHLFDGESIERALEGRAQIGALAEAQEPRAALAALVSFLPLHEAESPHAAGYRAQAARLVGEILRDPAAFPSIVPGRNILQQLDRLSAGEARELGRRLCAREF